MLRRFICRVPCRFFSEKPCDERPLKLCRGPEKFPFNEKNYIKFNICYTLFFAVPFMLPIILMFHQLKKQS